MIQFTTGHINTKYQSPFRNKIELIDDDEENLAKLNILFHNTSEKAPVTAPVS